MSNEALCDAWVVKVFVSMVHCNLTCFFLICEIIYSDVQSSMVIVVLLNSNTFVLTRELDSVAPKLFIVQHGYISKEFMISNS